MSAEVTGNYLESLSPAKKNFLFGVINLDRKDLELSWDLDQTLAISEDPVKAAIDAKYGTHYTGRRTDGWNSITKWLVEDGVVTKEQAEEDEKHFWRNNEVLATAKPNERLQWLSYTAYIRGIPQSITTVRSPGLRQMSYKWVNEYFPWIPAEKLNFRITMGMTGEHFKIRTILNRYKESPGLVHIDDDLTIIKPISEAAPELGLIGIRYPSDNVDWLNHSPNRIFIERDILNSLIPYGPFT